jgi:nitrite reductase (NADH) large subunit
MPTNCSEAYVKDIGLVAVEGGWEVYVGGAAGASVRKGDLLATVENEEQAKRIALAFLQHYRETGDHLERTYGYMERVGLEAVQEIVLDPDRQAELIDRFNIAKAACDPDPWRERSAPVHPKQFSELDSDPEGLDLVALANAESVS